MSKAEYAEYLRSPHWKSVRQWALERAENRCQLCNRDQRLHVHHRTYERVGSEQPGDLIVLCEDCHSHFHAGRSVAPRRKPRSRAKSTALQELQLGARGKKARVRRAIIELLESVPGESYTAPELALHLGISASRAGANADVLERGGFIRRVRGPKRPVWAALEAAEADAHLLAIAREAA